MLVSAVGRSRTTPTPTANRIDGRPVPNRENYESRESTRKSMRADSRDLSFPFR